MENPSKIVICMGVCGTGKSTLARYLASEFGAIFLDADDLHSAENKAHMAAGHPLTDAMRAPWIDALCEAVTNTAGDVVLAYSGLRRAHRERFRHLGKDCVFLHLKAGVDCLQGRLAARSGHFMPSTLIESQFGAMEPTVEEIDVVSVETDSVRSATQTQSQIQVQNQVKFLVRPFFERSEPASSTLAPNVFIGETRL